MSYENDITIPSYYAGVQGNVQLTEGERSFSLTADNLTTSAGVNIPFGEDKDEARAYARDRYEHAVAVLSREGRVSV